DGFMVLRCKDQEYQLLFEPDKGEFFNETTFVTSANALEEMQVQVISGKQGFICASTDGLERVAIRLSDWQPHPPFFKPLEEYLRETEKPENDDNYINDFLNSERLNSRTDDDKTLVLCCFEQEVV
ncbi:MAG: protein phosphatase 2C domain-containing protein, partial [Dolichospermum sp.]